MTDIPSEDDWISKWQVLARYGITAPTLTKWIRTEKISVIRRPWGSLFRVEDIEPVYRAWQKDKVRRLLTRK
jgi:predicted site-specific integrase-resolvase